MKIQYASDLHLEMLKNRRFIEDNPLIPKADILVLAGDIIYLHDMYYRMKIISDWSKAFERVYIVPGNHEYYNKSFPLSHSYPSLNLKIRKNVYIVNNQAIIIDDVRLIFSTLHTRISEKDSGVIKRKFNDFRQTVYKDDTLTTQQYNDCYFQCELFIKNELDKPFSGKTIIVTHHIPYLPIYIPDYPYHGSELNQVFHINLEDVLANHSIDYWISGHSHFNHAPIKINNTICLTNQLGYVDWNEHHLFSRDQVINL